MLNLNNIRLVAPYTIEGIKKAGIWEVQSFLKKKTIVGLDIETTGLDPHTGKIVMVQIGDHKKQFIIDVRYLDISFLKEEIESKKIVGANLKFEYKWLKKNYNWTLNKVYDVMLAEKTLHNNKLEEEKGFYSLSQIAERYLNVEFSPLVLNKGGTKILQEQKSLFPELSFSKATRMEFEKIGNTPFTIQQICYGANDIWMPILIRRKQLKELAPRYLKDCAQFENRYLPVVANMELKGMYMDTEMWMENYEKYVEKENAAISVLKETQDINWNSSKQVTAVFKELGIPTQIIDKKNSSPDEVKYKDSVGELHINKYSKQYPIIKPYLQYKNLKKLTSSYGEKFLTNVNYSTGRVHSNFFQFITTGRMASSSPNLQQIPAGKKGEGFRECFKPEEGNVFIVSDYSSQESRIIADIANEKAMIAFFNGKETDIH